MGERLINRSQVHLHDFLALLRIRFVNGILDRLHGVLCRQDAGDREETRLHHGVDSAPHSCVARDLVPVDDEELRALFDEPALYIFWQTAPNTLWSQRRL